MGQQLPTLKKFYVAAIKHKALANSVKKFRVAEEQKVETLGKGKKAVKQKYNKSGGERSLQKFADRVKAFLLDWLIPAKQNYLRR